MQAGRLRHRVTLQRRVESRDATGAVVWTWADWADRWAAIEPIHGREYFAAAQVQSAVTTRVRLRYTRGVTPKMRVKFVDAAESPRVTRYFDIEAVLRPAERPIETVLMCVEREAEGFRDGN